MRRWSSSTPSCLHRSRPGTETESGSRRRRASLPYSAQNVKRTLMPLLGRAEDGCGDSICPYAPFMERREGAAGLDAIWAVIDLEPDETPIAYRPLSLVPGLAKVPWWIALHPRVQRKRRAVRRRTGGGVAFLTDRRIIFRSATFVTALKRPRGAMVFRWGDIESWAFDNCHPRPGRTGLAITVRYEGVEKPGVFTFFPAKPFPTPETDFFRALSEQLDKHVGSPRTHE